jgi:hypothetical protein
MTTGGSDALLSPAEASPPVDVPLSLLYVGDASTPVDALLLADAQAANDMSSAHTSNTAKIRFI